MSLSATFSCAGSSASLTAKAQSVVSSASLAPPKHRVTSKQPACAPAVVALDILALDILALDILALDILAPDDWRSTSTSAASATLASAQLP
jgi:hypothetical protein